MHLKLPAKVRIFAWRACVNGLPTRMNMVTRGIDVDASCPLYGKEGESTKQLFSIVKKFVMFGGFGSLTQSISWLKQMM